MVIYSMLLVVIRRWVGGACDDQGGCADRFRDMIGNGEGVNDGSGVTGCDVVAAVALYNPESSASPFPRWPDERPSPVRLKISPMAPAVEARSHSVATNPPLPGWFRSLLDDPGVHSGGTGPASRYRVERWGRWPRLGSGCARHCVVFPSECGEWLTMWLRHESWGPLLSRRAMRIDSRLVRLVCRDTTGLVRCCSLLVCLLGAPWQASIRSILGRFKYFLQGNCIVHHMFGDDVSLPPGRGL